MRSSKFTIHFLLFAAAGFFFVQQPGFAQEVPAPYSNIHVDSVGNYYWQLGDQKIPELQNDPEITMQEVMGDPEGTENGLRLNFGPRLKGKVYYGFIHYQDGAYPQPVYFKRAISLKNGRVEIDIKNVLSGRYDMIGWQRTGLGTIGYRLVAEDGTIMYDGKVSFEGVGPFEVVPTIVEGPFVNKLTHESATISFTTHQAVKATVKVGENVFSDPAPTQHHEIELTGLSPDTEYKYEVSVNKIDQQFTLTTAPAPGSRKPFVFAYASDSRSGQGGGERDVYGANFYIMKKIMALTSMKGAAFMQFSGDLVDGYVQSAEEISVQYANWKRAVEPYWHHTPIFVSMGNHEALMRVFSDGKRTASLDRFPFATESAEALFAQNFVQFENGPNSEDGAAYDPNKKQTDFPTYKENVFYYSYDNVAVVVLNSDYFYAPSTSEIPEHSGGMHAYIMDQQLEWFKKTMKKLEKDDSIDHIFVTQHTPFFPNGGHVKDDMWYNGQNKYRPYVNGKPMKKGIIERRDQLLEQIVNKSEKGIAILTGDEHNFALTTVSPEMERYPEGWDLKKIDLKRTVYQVNNGAAGAPYYAQEETPWTPHVSGFTTRNALVFFYVDGQSLEMEVINPDTLETFMKKKLR